MVDNLSYKERMERKLTAAFQPIHMEIKDDSKKHAGHAGHDPRGETHFLLKIVSKSFEGKNAVARHRLVYGALAEELKERVHALNISALTPEEHKGA